MWEETEFGQKTKINELKNQMSELMMIMKQCTQAQFSAHAFIQQPDFQRPMIEYHKDGWTRTGTEEHKIIL